MSKHQVIALLVVLSGLFFVAGFIGGGIIHRPTKQAHEKELEKARAEILEYLQLYAQERKSVIRLMDLNNKNCSEKNKTIDALKLQVKRGYEFFNQTIDIFAETMAKFGEPQADIDEFVLEYKTRFSVYTAFGDGTDNENQESKGVKK